MLVDAGRPPKIVEIGHVPFIRQAFPETTEFYSSWPDALAVRGERGHRLVSLATLPQLAGRLADPALDLIVVHAPAFSPWSGRALVRSLFRRSILTGNIALFRGFATELLRRPPAAPVAILDFDDANTVARCNLFLLDRATLYFKRELPADHWLAFAGTLHWRVPTPRFRALKQNRTRIAKLRPISLGASPAAVMRMEPLPMPCEKTIDVFFAGRLGAAATVRERGVEELRQLQHEGFAIDVAERALPPDEYLSRCARAYLAWSPQGYGWQCFRTYEAALCGTAPLCNRAGIELHRPFADGVHAIYYNVEPGELARTVKAALSDRERLRRIGAAAREHAIAFHTPTAIARYVVETTLGAQLRTAPASSASHK